MDGNLAGLEIFSMRDYQGSQIGKEYFACISNVFPLAGSMFMMNSPAMFRIHFWRSSLWLMLAVPLSSHAKEVPVAPVAQKPTQKIPFTLDQVVNTRVGKMAVPEMRPNIVGVKISISSASEKARAHVTQGFALVHAQWDFEAYRHFCAALVEDPDCLMAYCGVSLALAQPFNEYSSYRMAAVSRMQDLMEEDDRRQKAGEATRYTLMEKKFTYAVATLVAVNPKAAGTMLLKLGDEFPHFLQARLLGVVMTRGGYDVLGDPTPKQQVALQKTRALLLKHPDNPMVLGFWLSLNAAAPNQALDFKKDVLPYARRLVTKCPRVPSWQHALGHFEWRAGNYLLAERAFTNAANLYAEWMKREGVGVNDCEGYIRAKCYLASTLYQRGDFLGAMKIARELRTIKPDVKRPNSPGNQILLWRAYTLPARLYMTHGAKGDMNRALQSLPTQVEMKPFVVDTQIPTLAGVYIDALKAYCGCRKAITAGDTKAADGLRKKTLHRYIVSLANVAPGARKFSDYGHFFRAGISLEIYSKELAGLTSMVKSPQSLLIAAGSFHSARDLQAVPTMMLPPLILTPMENRLGELYLRMGKNTEALDVYKEGEKRYPNNIESLLGIKRSFDGLGRKDAAAIVQKQIDLVKTMK